MQGGSRQNGELIRDSDHIRLCWSFADQRGGFRDYTDDVFGRRRFHVPEDEPENLYVKLPFPGFQRSDTADGIAMIMHTEEATKSYATTLNVLPHKEFDNVGIATYGLYDLSFRLDVLGMFKLSGCLLGSISPLLMELNSYNRHTWAAGTQ